MCKYKRAGKLEAKSGEWVVVEVNASCPQSPKSRECGATEPLEQYGEMLGA